MPGKLKIVFICSSIQPGQDGVGDYTRRLAAALINAGHSCAILSVNDRHVENTLAELQNADGVDVPVIRFSAGLEIKQRFMLAKEWIDAYSPQWLSLQFVPFGYHPKGLKVGLSKLLLTLSNGRKWHIMFHELWVGMADEESKKLHLWGSAQRLLIRSLLQRLKPAAIHTQTRLYQTLLGKMGINAEYLPLYSNIPFLAPPKQHTDIKEKIAFVVFGAIHNRAPIVEFATEAAVFAKKHRIPVSLSIIGRGGSEQQRWAAAWENKGLPVQIKGELLPEEVSAALSASNIGLSATALAVIEKSGSFAAMREHGLPVISVAKPWTPIGTGKPDMPAGVIEYTPGNFENCIANCTFIPPGSGVDAISVKFAQALYSIKAG